MSLQAKFAILLAVFGSAVVIALAAAWWSLEVTYREVRGPVESSSNVLNLLVAIERDVDELRALADPGDAFRSGPVAIPESEPPSPPALLTRQTFEARAAVIGSLLRGIGSESEWTGYAGKTATRNLEDKVELLNATVEAWLTHGELPTPAGGDAATLPLIRNQLFQIHELIKAMERRVIEDIQNLASSGANLRLRLMIVLGLALVLVGLTAALGLLLVRRWIVHPVSELRNAAARIAAGDFEHRVPVMGRGRDELAALSGEVNHMAGMVKQMQAERVEQERLAAIGEGVRIVAHNLRDPISGVRGLAELSQRRAARLGAPGQEIGEFQARIVAAVDRFHDWLTNLVNATRPTSIAPRPTDPARWLEGIMAAHLPLAQTRGVELDLRTQESPRSVVIDGRQLELAVSAILSNAIDATAGHEGRTDAALIRITSREVEDGGSGRDWELRIEDRGPGVPPDLREAIFKPYFTTKAHGSGIGLAVAQQVVRAHGGQIGIETAETGRAGPEIGPPTAGGAVFVIRIPIGDRPEEGATVARIGQ